MNKTENQENLKANKPIQGVIFMHPDGPCLREVENKLLQDDIYRLTGNENKSEKELTNFYLSELGINCVMLITNLSKNEKTGFKYTDFIKVDIRQFGEWKTWEEFFDLIQAAILVFANPNFKLKSATPTDNEK